MEATIINLPMEHMKNVCKIYAGKNACSFLILGQEGFECSKGTLIQSIIAERRANKSIAAQGDNCSGPPNFTPYNNS